MAAFFISIAMIKSGFARRLALVFVRAFGKSSLGITYALSMTDMLLAGIIPSNGARSGGVVLPIARSIAELYGSRPGVTAPLLGAFLMTAVYQNICVTAAMFMTGQASNPWPRRSLSDTFHFPMTWTLWALACIVPGLCSLALIPLLIYRMDPPAIRKTPEAAPSPRLSCAAWAAWMGLSASCSSSSRRLRAVDLHAVASFGNRHTGLLGACALLATGVLRWEDVLAERAAWDTFIWYGACCGWEKALNEAGVTRESPRRWEGCFPGRAGWCCSPWRC